MRILVGCEESQTVTKAFRSVGHGETKATCLWLKNLPPLIYSGIHPSRRQAMHLLSPSKDSAKLRSKTYQGIADAMAAQWGSL